MRLLLTLLLLSCVASAQQAGEANSSIKVAQGQHADAHRITIPAGTRIPIALKNAISTKANHEGDPIFARTTFPVVINEKIVIPVGTYVQGKISAIKPAGHIKGRAEVLIHFTTLIYPSGYTVMLPGSIENAPSVDNGKVKDKEGTIKGDSNAGKTAETVATAAGTGALVGSVVEHSAEGAGIGAGAGAAVGTVLAALGHSNDVRMGPGTTLEVVLQRDVPVDGSRVGTAASTAGEPD
jgi:hypothetical protein